MAEQLGTDEFVDLVEIGRGGFGIVYRAHQPAFRRTIALKVLTSINDVDRRRFISEQHALGAVSNHPHIPEVFGSGVTPSGAPYFAMAYMEGGSFGDLIDGERPVAWQDALTIGVKIAGALETAHRSGILHRDIKPENVLLSAFGEPQLADFGIAAMAGATQTATGSTPMSLAYAAPEVLNGNKPSVASDVYSLGATVFTLISGHAPFWREDDHTLMALYLRTAEDPLPDLRPRGVPDGLCRVVERATSKNPADRHPSAEDFGRALQSVQHEWRLPTTDMVLHRPLRPDASASGGEPCESSESDSASRVQPVAGAAPETVVARPQPRVTGSTVVATGPVVPSRSRRPALVLGVVVALVLVGLVAQRAKPSSGRSEDAPRSLRATTSVVASGTPSTSTTGAIPAAAVDPSGLLFEDDFSRNRGWQVGDVQGIRWEIRDGKYVATPPNAGTSLYTVGRAPLSAAEVPDRVRLRVSVAFATSSNNLMIAALMCRSQGRPKYQASIHPDGSWSVQRAGTDGPSDRNLDVGRLAEPPRLVDPLSLELECAGAGSGDPVSLRFSVNGRLVSDIKDPNGLPSGQVGLSGGGKQALPVVFDDFSVVRLP